MEIQKLTEEEIKLVELWKKIPDIGNEPPMFHVTENQVDFPTLLSLEGKGIMERPKRDHYAEAKKKLNGEKWVSFHLTGWKLN